MAASIPTLEQIGLVWVEQTVPSIAAASLGGTRRGAQVAKDRATADTDLLHNDRDRPALLAQGSYLLIGGLPAPLALRQALLGGLGCFRGWDRHRGRPIG